MSTLNFFFIRVSLELLVSVLDVPESNEASPPGKLGGNESADEAHGKESFSQELTAAPAPSSTPDGSPLCSLIPLSPIGRTPIPLFAGSSVVMGRSNMCDVVLSNPMISRVCSKIQIDEAEGGAHFVLTSYTTNVQINGETECV